MSKTRSRKRQKSSDQTSLHRDPDVLPTAPKEPVTTEPEPPKNVWEMLWSFSSKSRWRMAFFVAIAVVVASVSFIWNNLPEDMQKDLIASLARRQRWSVLSGSLPGVEVCKQNRVVDLRGWAPADGETAKDVALFEDEFSVRKTRPDAKFFCITAGSTGSRPEVSSGDTHQIKTYDMREMDLLGWPKMQNQIVAAADISREPANVEFPLKIKTKRIGGFKDPTTNWCSVGIWHPTKTFTYTVVFPQNKIGRDFVLKRAFFDNSNNLETLDITKEDFKVSGNTVVWNMNHPPIGYAFQIWWNW